MTATVCLTAGLACSAAAFGIVRAVLLEELPYATPEQIVRVSRTDPEKGWDWIRLSPAEVVIFRRSARCLEDLAAYETTTFTWTGSGRTRRVWAVATSPNLFRLLGVRAAVGRTLTPEDEGSRVAVLSHSFWWDELAGDESALGRSLVLDGEAYTAVGVMPVEFEFPPDQNYDLWVPALPPFDARTGDARNDRSLFAVARASLDIEQYRTVVVRRRMNMGAGTVVTHQSSSGSCSSAAVKTSESDPSVILSRRIRPCGSTKKVQGTARIWNRSVSEACSSS